MKKNLLLLLSFLVFISCDKEGKTNDAVNLFTTPLTNWTLTKEAVRSQERHNLVEDTRGEDILLLIGPWNSHGDGSLKYSGDNFFTHITYGFYNDKKTLECVHCGFNITNIVTEEKVLSFMQSKYNKEYAICKTDKGNNYIFQIPDGIVVLSVKSTGTIIYTKKEHEWYYKY